MITKKISFSIADIKFLYDYNFEMEIPDDAPINNFVISCDTYDINNYIVYNKDFDYKTVQKEGVLKFKTPSWQLYHYNNQEIYLFIQKNLYIGCLYSDDDFSNVQTILSRTDFIGQPLPICITGFLLQRKLTIEGKGFIMHGATIEVGNKGLVLTGNSGVGKSTLSKLITSNTKSLQVSDDRFILKYENGVFYSYGNPFDFKLERNKNKKTKITDIIFLNHGDHNELRYLKKNERMGKLITISLLAYWDKETLKKNIQELEKFLNCVNCYEYGFVPNKTAVEYLTNNLLM